MGAERWERLKNSKVYQALPDQELEALGQFVSIMRFIFGFIRRASCDRTGRMPGEWQRRLRNF